MPSCFRDSHVQFHAQDNHVAFTYCNTQCRSRYLCGGLLCGRSQCSLVSLKRYQKHQYHVQRRRHSCMSGTSSSATPSDKTYDVVVIGSGLGGLSAAALLSAAYGKSVCVCESHAIPGGAAHSFTRNTEAGQFTFDSGPHLFSGLSMGGTLGELSANPMQHVLRAVSAELPCKSYDTWGCLFPDGYFATRVAPSEPLFSSLIGAVSGPAAQAEVASLIRAMLPLCAASTALPPACLRAGDIIGSLRVASRYFMNPKILASLPSMPKLMQPFEPFMHKYITDPFTRNFLDLLCFLLAGVPAAQIPLAEVGFMFSEWTGATAGADLSDTVLEHPVGGAAGIVNALVDAIERNPMSKVRVNAHVAEITLSRSRHKSRKRASGVVLSSGENVFAREGVISNTSAWDLPKLIPSMNHMNELSESANSSNLPMCPSFLHLHLAFEMSEQLKQSLPHKLELNYVSVEDWSAGISAPQNVVLISIPSLADETVAPPNHLVLHAYAPATEPYDIWANVSNASEYNALKAARTEFLWRAVVKVIPKARSLAKIKMAGSPLTHKRFLRRFKGTYGPEIDARMFGNGSLLPGQCRSDIAEALWCVGDSTFPGIGVPAVAASAWFAANSFTSVNNHDALLRRIGL